MEAYTEVKTSLDLIEINKHHTSIYFATKGFFGFMKSKKWEIGEHKCVVKNHEITGIVNDNLVYYVSTKEGEVL